MSDDHRPSATHHAQAANRYTLTEEEWGAVHDALRLIARGGSSTVRGYTQRLSKEALIERARKAWVVLYPNSPLPKAERMP